MQVYLPLLLSGIDDFAGWDSWMIGFVDIA
jgi:hypothetical protein